MILVSGMPRSGMNVMMNLISNAFGEERILGNKYPMQYHWDEYLKKQDGETEEMFLYRLYVFKDQHPDPDGELEEIFKLCPDGFWDSSFVRGVVYRPNIKQDTDRLLSETSEIPLFCKVSAGGVGMSNPKHVDKVIFMMRDPREIVKSKERLMSVISTLDKSSLLAREAYKSALSFSPEMFSQEMYNFSQWVNDNPKVAVYYCLFNDLIENPKETLKSIQEFIGGDFGGVKSIDYQIITDKEASPEWDESSMIYEMLLANDLDVIVEFFDEPVRKMKRMNARWICMRTKTPTVEKQCKQCKYDKNFRAKMREHADKNNIDWRNQPCAYECVYEQDCEHVSMEESIENNFWINDTFVKPQLIPDENTAWATNIR